MIQHALPLFERQVKASPSIGKTKRALHVPGTVHLNDPQTRMLLVIRAQATIVRASMGKRRRKCKRDGTGFVKLRCGRIGPGIGIDQGFTLPVFRTSLAHVDLILTQKDMGVYDPTTVRANTAGQLIEDVVSVLLCANKGEGGYRAVLHASSCAPRSSEVSCKKSSCGKRIPFDTR